MLEGGFFMSNGEFVISEITLGDRSMRYLSAGEGDNYAVILQGWATDYKVYSLIISRLSKKYHVIFPLLPGFGGEKEPSGPMSVSDYAILVNELLTKLNITHADFFCHSYGGRILFKLAADESRFTLQNRVILCDVAGILPKKSPAKKIRIKLFKFTRKLLSTKVMRFIYPDLLTELLAKSGSEDYRNSSPVMRQTLVMAVNEDLYPLITNVSAQTLILWGKNDDAVPLSDAYLIEKEIKDSAVVVFEHSGHFPFATEWRSFNAVLSSFLNIEQ